MHNYYFKIRKNDTEIEFSTNNLEDFDKKVLAWTEKICSEQSDIDNPNKKKRMDFIEIRNLVKINDIGSAPEKPVVKEFEEVLETAVMNPKLELDKKLAAQNELFELIAGKNINTQFDYLIMAAFYMLHFENLQRFTIKQINSRLVPLKIEPITHKVIQGAVLEEYIEIVPDLTGLGDVMEYALTQKGEEYYYNAI